jgi:Ca2+-binding RTX toxin-like protein
MIKVASTDPTLGGKDTLAGGAGNDTLFGGTGDDTLFGDEGDDVLLGDHGLYDLSLPVGQRYVASILIGPRDGGGNDTIYGGTGNDIIFGQQGDDLLDGGEGEDTFCFQNGWGQDLVLEADDAGYDTLDFSAVTTDLTIRFGSLLVTSRNSPADTAVHSENNIERVLPGSGRFTTIGLDEPDWTVVPLVPLEGTPAQGLLPPFPEGLVTIPLPPTTSTAAAITVFYPSRSYVDATAFARDRSQLQGGDAGGLGATTTPTITSLTSSVAQVGGVGEHQAIAFAEGLANLAPQDIRTAVVAWGDGTVEPAALVEGPEGWTVAGHHAYAAGGVYDITLAITTTEGAVATQVAKARITGAGISDRVLQIVGTAGDDVVEITRDGEFITVRADFLAGEGHTRTFRAADFDVIVILTGAGSNNVEIDASIAQPVVTDGATRNDALAAGGLGQVLLSGGPGNDALLGAWGQALRQGQRGAAGRAGGRGVAHHTEPATPQPGIIWAGPASRAPRPGGSSAPTPNARPGLREFALPETWGSAEPSAHAEARLPLTVLTLDTLGKFLGPQLGNGSGQKKNGTSSAQSRR